MDAIGLVMNEHTWFSLCVRVWEESAMPLVIV